MTKDQIIEKLMEIREDDTDWVFREGIYGYPVLVYFNIFLKGWVVYDSDVRVSLVDPLDVNEVAECVGKHLPTLKEKLEVLKDRIIEDIYKYGSFLVQDDTLGSLLQNRFPKLGKYSAYQLEEELFRLLYLDDRVVLCTEGELDVLLPKANEEASA